MNNENIGQEIEQKEAPKQGGPKLFLFIFKFIGVLYMIGGGLAGALAVVNLFSIEDFFKFLKDLEILGIYAIAFLLGYGCWKIRKWVIPFWAIIAVSVTVLLLINFFTLQHFNLATGLISGFSLVLFAVAYYHRQYFMGSYRVYWVYVVYGLVMILAVINYYI